MNAVRSLPRLLRAACVCLGVALVITAIGIGLGLLPEDFDVEWNGLPLSEYDLGDVTGGIVVFGLAAAILAAIHLVRGGEGATPGARRLAKWLVAVGLVPLVVVAALVALLLALCSGGGCS